MNSRLSSVRELGMFEMIGQNRVSESILLYFWSVRAFSRPRLLQQLTHLIF